MRANNRVPRKKACMLAYAFYENDNRINRYVATLSQLGWSVDVIALRRPGMPFKETIDNGTIYRIQKRVRNEKIKIDYVFRMLTFLFRSFIFISRKQLKEKYSLIHVHTPPDIEIFATLLPKLMDTKVILDIHDIMPEFFMSKFRASGYSFVLKLLILLERLSTRFADHVIVANDIWRERLIHRSVPKEKCSAILNFVDRNVFKKPNRQPMRERLVILYPGGLQWHQGLDIAIRAFSKIKDIETRADLHIYGEGEQKTSLLRMIDELQLHNRVFIHDPVPLDYVPKLMAEAHIGIVCKRADSFGNEAYSTKIMEFMSQGVPVIVSRTQIDSFYFKDDEVCFFNSEDEEQLAMAILKILRDEEYRRYLIENSLRYVEENCWENRKNQYLSIIEKLTGLPTF